MELRGYQSKLIHDVYGHWANGIANVLLRLDTGGGKTFILANIVNGHLSARLGAVCVMAHRDVLVGQLSLALARLGVRHNLICSAKTLRGIIAEHMAELGRSYYDQNSLCAVTSVDTLVKAKGLERWASQVTLWIVDEAHHLVLDNKWDTARKLFTHPNCRGLGPTATPSRADGKGLGAHADGVFQTMVEGPPMRWLIDNGFLTDYRIICSMSDMQLLESELGANGDWSTSKLKEASKQSKIVGDVVREYQKYASGKLGITFTTDVDTAKAMAAEYRAAGVPAEVLTGETDSGFRRSILARFKARQILQIVAVDIISEGFDLPAIEVVSFARPTNSLALYMQQFGRALRIMDGKIVALIIDHVGNVARHLGPPDKPRIWTLDRREKRSSQAGDKIPERVCGAGHKPGIGCFQPYERFLKKCPFCGLEPPPPEVRSGPESVDGDLVELSPEILAALRGEIDLVWRDPGVVEHALAATGLHHKGVRGNVNRHMERQHAHLALRSAMDQFGGSRLQLGRSDSEMQREFYLAFGIDVLSAQALATGDAEKLTERIRAYV